VIPTKDRGQRVFTLADGQDSVFNFGVRQEFVWDDSVTGCLRPPTRWERIKLRVAPIARRWTRWLRPRNIVSRIDYESGSITVDVERWSWLRWRWERVA
jgi:hypothetical protein